MGFPSSDCTSELIAGSRPERTDARESQVTLGELRSTAVHSIEDVDHDVDGHAVSTQVLVVKIDLAGRVQVLQPVHIQDERLGGHRLELAERLSECFGPERHQFSDRDPQRIARHLRGPVELE
jgi:hypothetical protein